MIQGRSNWVGAPLAHVRSAGEVATDPAITLRIYKGGPVSGICRTSLEASSVQTSRKSAD